MSMFRFDEQYAYYGTTPVDNQFILEYLPGASGDAVRVYLYGLMQCLYPQGDTSIDRMARELGLTREDILAAYRHWERKGLVCRIADEPPTYRYVSIAQRLVSGTADFQVDEVYEAFSAAVYSIFGSERKIHGKDMAYCYEWVEKVGLPAEVVLHLIRHMVALNGKKVPLKHIEQKALELAKEEISTVEDAEDYLRQDKVILDGARAVLRRFNRRRNPTQDELDMYRRWVKEWAFTAEDILAACAETTKGEPNFAYLDGILRRLNQKQQGAKVAEMLSGEKEQSAPLRALLNVLHQPGLTVNDATLAQYEEMRDLYPDAIILMAGQECAKRGKDLEDVMTTLKVWKRNQLVTPADVRAYMAHVDELNDVLKMVYEVTGLTAAPNFPDRRLVEKWLEEYRFELSFLLQCAALAVGKEKPMAYLDKLLENCYAKGIRTAEALQKEREAFQAQHQQKQQGASPRQGGKVVAHQQYTQREYVHSEDELDALMAQWQEENGNA